MQKIFLLIQACIFLHLVVLQCNLCNAFRMHHHPSFVYASNRMNHKSYVASDCSTPTRRQLTTSRLQSTNADSNGHDLAVSHYDEVIPFLSEHIQKSDQMLLLGASTDFSLKLVKDGFGVAKTGYMVVVDEDQANIDKLSQAIAQDAELSKYQQDGKLKLIATDFTNMPQVCRQSVFDSIVDYCAMDKLLRRPNGKECFLKCVDHLQNSLRLGNLLVCISKEDKELFTEPFEERFGWVQELDGEPGELSKWYRGKSNIAPNKSNFASLGLKMYVYTNTDNC